MPFQGPQLWLPVCSVVPYDQSNQRVKIYRSHGVGKLSAFAVVADGQFDRPAKLCFQGLQGRAERTTHCWGCNAPTNTLDPNHIGHPSLQYLLSLVSLNQSLNHAHKACEAAGDERKSSINHEYDGVAKLDNKRESMLVHSIRQSNSF